MDDAERKIKDITFSSLDRVMVDVLLSLLLRHLDCWPVHEVALRNGS